MSTLVPSAGDCGARKTWALTPLGSSVLNVRRGPVVGNVITPSLPGVPKSSESRELSIMLYSTAVPSAWLPSLRAAAQRGLVSNPDGRSCWQELPQVPRSASDTE